MTEKNKTKAYLKIIQLIYYTVITGSILGRIFFFDFIIIFILKYKYFALLLITVVIILLIIIATIKKNIPGTVINSILLIFVIIAFFSSFQKKDILRLYGFYNVEDDKIRISDYGEKIIINLENNITELIYSDKSIGLHNKDDILAVKYISSTAVKLLNRYSLFSYINSRSKAFYNIFGTIKNDQIHSISVICTAAQDDSAFSSYFKYRDEKLLNSILNKIIRSSNLKEEGKIKYISKILFYRATVMHPFIAFNKPLLAFNIDTINSGIKRK